jgi:hypothetical protein
MDADKRACADKDTVTNVDTRGHRTACIANADLLVHRWPMLRLSFVKILTSAAARW